MTSPLFVHFQTSGGPEPYLLHIEADAWGNKFECLLRPPVTVQPPKGFTERDMNTRGLESRMVVPWLAQMAKTVRTVVTYDADRLLQVMETEISRLGRGAWSRPGIQFISLKDKAACMKEVPEGADLSIATASIYGAPQDNLQGIKALHEHEEIKTLLELV
jgi:hypothetical protein